MVPLVLLRIILVVLLVAANAFFVAAEFAMVSLRDTRVHQLIEQRRIGARTVQKIQRHLDESLTHPAKAKAGWVREHWLPSSSPGCPEFPLARSTPTPSLPPWPSLPSPT